MSEQDASARPQARGAFSTGRPGDIVRHCFLDPARKHSRREDMMRARYLKIAGTVLAGMTAAIHIFAGTYDTLLPLLATDLPAAIKGTFQACWHFLSIFLVVSVWCFGRTAECAKSFAWLWIAFGTCFLAAGLLTAGYRGLLVLPQWILLCPAGALILLGLRTKKETA